MTTLNARDGEEDSVDDPGPQENMLESQPNEDDENACEMFIGEGLADSSVCSVASVCSSISQPITEESLIDSIFFACDSSKTGQVPVSSLLDYIKVYINAEDCEDSKDLEDLWMMFDSNGMDILVTHETYRQIMGEWVCRLRRASGCMLWRNQNCADLIEFSPGSPPPCSPIPNMPLRSTLSPVYPSPGASDPYALVNYTIGSLEGTGGDRSSLDEIELVTEMSELQFQNKKLQEKLQKLHAQTASTEDQNMHLLSEKDALIKKLDSLQLIAEKYREVEHECLELRSSLSKVEEAYLLSKEKILQLEKENALLELRNKAFRKDLNSAYADLEETKMLRDQLERALEEKQLNLGKTEEEMKHNGLIYEQQISKIQELEASLKEWMQLSKDLTLEKRNIENKLSEALDACASAEQECRLKQSVEIKRQSLENGSLLCSTIRTPAKRLKLDYYEPDCGGDVSMASSLHAEIHSLVEQNVNLPSPFCEKPILIDEGSELYDDNQKMRSCGRRSRHCRRRPFPRRLSRSMPTAIDGDEGLWSRESESDTDDGVSVDEELLQEIVPLSCTNPETGNEKDSGFEIEMTYTLNTVMTVRQNAYSVLQLALQLLSIMVKQMKGDFESTSPSLPQASEHVPWTERPPVEDGIQALSKCRLGSTDHLDHNEHSKDQMEIVKLFNVLDNETKMKKQLKADLKDNVTKELGLLSQQLAKTQAVLTDVLRKASATSVAVATTTAINLPFADLGRKEDVHNQPTCNQSFSFLAELVPSETDCSPEHNSESFSQYSTIPRPKFRLQSEHLQQTKTQSLDQDRSLSPSSVCLRCHHRVLSCPVLPSQISLVTKGTQTDLCWVDTRCVAATRRDEIPSVHSSESPLKQHDTVLETSVSVDARSRLRSNSFLAAVHDGNPHLNEFTSEEEQIADIKSAALDEPLSPDIMRESGHGPRKLSILHEEDHEDPCLETVQSILPNPNFPQTTQPLPPPYRPPPLPSLCSFSRSTPHLSQIFSNTFSTHSLEDLHKGQPGSILPRTFSVSHSSFSSENRPSLQKRFSVDLSKSNEKMDEEASDYSQDKRYKHCDLNPQSTKGGLQKLSPTKQSDVESDEVKNKTGVTDLSNVDRRGSRRRRLAFAGLVPGSIPIIKRSSAVEFDEPEICHQNTALPSSGLRTSRPLSAFKSRSSRSHSQSSSLITDMKALESESFRGSGGSTESESELQPFADANHVPGSTTKEEVETMEGDIFSEEVLRNLSVGVSSSMSNQTFKTSGDKLNEEEIEYEFRRLTLGIQTAQATIHVRLDLHQRQRDLAEDDVRRELTVLKENLKSLELDVLANEVLFDTQIHHLLRNLQHQVDVILRATTKVAACSTVFGAIQQEQKVGDAVAIMVEHVENVKRQCEVLQNELEQMRNNCPKFSDTLGSSKALLQMHPAVSRRRASIAGNPRSSLGEALGWCMNSNVAKSKGGSPGASTPVCKRQRSSSVSPSAGVTESSGASFRTFTNSGGQTVIEQEEVNADLLHMPFSQESTVTSNSSSTNDTTDTQLSARFACQNKETDDDEVAVNADILNSMNSSFHLSGNCSSISSCARFYSSFEEKEDNSDDDIIVEYLHSTWPPTSEVKPLNRWWLKLLPTF